tara:strand:+ start:159 stop:917 length:759 start_codon:yes stop_codon:yes gene_type:complete
MRFKKIKKGEITTQQIVFLIILITSFVVILFLFFRLNLGEVSNKEICHNSVVLKGKSVSGFGSLDCKTNYLCISGGEDCEGINPTQTIEVDPKNETQVLRAITDEMVDCWWMFGEGNVNYVEDYSGTHCAVCSTVKFDEVLKGNEISYDDLFGYLIKNKKSESQTFYQYLYPYFPKFDDLLNNFKYLSEEKDKKLDLTQSFSIMTGRNKEFEPTDIFPFAESESNDLIVPVYFIKTSDIKELGCTDFDITKA